MITQRPKAILILKAIWQAKFISSREQQFDDLNTRDLEKTLNRNKINNKREDKFYLCNI